MNLFSVQSTYFYNFTKYELIRIYISEIGIPLNVNLKYLFPAKYIHVTIALLYMLIIVNILNIILSHVFNILILILFIIVYNYFSNILNRRYENGKINHEFIFIYLLICYPCETTRKTNSKQFRFILFQP